MAERVWHENFDDCYICSGPTDASHQGEIAYRTSWYTPSTPGVVLATKFRGLSKMLGKMGWPTWTWKMWNLGWHVLTPCYAHSMPSRSLCFYYSYEKAPLRMMNGDYASKPGFHQGCLINFSMLAVNISDLRYGFNSFLSISL